MAESKKMEKNAFRPRPKNEKRRKLPENGFPTPWKWGKCQKTAFQPLGNGENASKRLSNPLEMGKMP